MSSDLLRWGLAFGSAALIALAARSRRSLSVDGAFTATIMGTVIVGAAGWWAGGLLVAFFATSSALSHRGKKHLAVSQARGSERDAVQVLANGGIAMLAAVMFVLGGATDWISVLAGSLAAANADTWSTEIGRVSRTPPRLVTNWRTVPAGTSGAVSVRGLMAALAGGFLIGMLAGIGWQSGWLPGNGWFWSGAIAVTLGGFSGSLVDSLLGATVQDQRWCDTCNKSTEARMHHCGTQTRHVSGIPWVNNDVVNVCCVLAGAAVTMALVRSLP